MTILDTNKEKDFKGIVDSWGIEDTVEMRMEYEEWIESISNYFTETNN